MNRRNLLLLGGSAVLVTGAALLLGPGQPTKTELGEAPLLFRDLAQRLQGAMRIEVKRHDQTLILQRQQGDVWVLPDQSNYPIRPEKLRELLVGLTELRLTEPRTANPELLAQLGLDDPQKPGSTASLLRVLDGSGAPIAELIIGRRRMRTQGNVPESVYLRRPNENQSWLAEGRLPIDADPQLWIDRDIANLPGDRVMRAEIAREGQPPLVLARADGGADGRLVVTSPAEHPPLEPTAEDEVARAFEFLTFNAVRPDRDIPGQRLGRTVFTLTDKLGITVEAWLDGDLIWAKFAASGDAEAERLNARWRGWAYQLGGWKAKAFMPRLEEMLRPDKPAP